MMAAEVATVATWHKYGAVRTAYDGVVYDSKAEAAYAELLDLRKAAGELTGWSRFSRKDAYLLVPGKTARERITYRPDFKVWREQPVAGRWRALPPRRTEWVVDVKGQMTQVFRLKAKVLHFLYPEVRLVIARRERDGTWTEEDWR